VPAVVAERILMADDAPRFELIERAQEDRPVLDAGALVELAAVVGGDAVLELAQADGVGELAEARGAAHDVEQRLQGRFPQVGRDVVEHPIRGRGGGPAGGERGIDGDGGRLYAHGVLLWALYVPLGLGARRLILSRNQQPARFLLGGIFSRSASWPAHSD